MKNRFISFFLTVMILVIGVPVTTSFTASANDDRDIIATGLRYGESVKTTVLKTETKTIVTTPSGQPPRGYKLPAGGTINVNPSGGGTISFDVSVTWGKVTIGTSIGYVQGGVTGVSIPVPSPNYYYQARLRKYYDIKRVKLDYYEYGVYKYTQYATHKVYQKVEGYAVRV